jgi:hypothetical protein
VKLLIDFSKYNLYVCSTEWITLPMYKNVQIIVL